MYVYESPDGGKTVYRRKPGEIKRELVKSEDIVIEVDGVIISVPINDGKGVL